MYKEKIINGLTGEETYRDYTPEEIAEVESAQAISAARVAEAEARATARASALAKLAALGLTADEIASL
jgi:hypothetical protein